MLTAHPLRELLSIAGPLPAHRRPRRALFGAWYELLPALEGATKDEATGGPSRHSFAHRRAPARRRIAAMGFDVVYLPPIHPIGEVNRKGPNNTLTPAPRTPGSPWAIGSEDGGHDAIHPDLGTIEDFDAFVAPPASSASRSPSTWPCSARPTTPGPAHPEWFTTRADGTIAYAENPPKKYQDIYPINFDNDPAGLYAEVLRVVQATGCRTACGSSGWTTRTPSPWPSGSGCSRSDPSYRPRRAVPRRGLHPPGDDDGLGASVGFHQSYTYFTWRTAKWELDRLPARAVLADRPT